MLTEKGLPFESKQLDVSKGTAPCAFWREPYVVYMT